MSQSARRAIAGDIDILQSKHDFDWLGPGAYFWESDPQRALEWAQWKADTGSYKNPYVVGAVIDLRNCLDLVARENFEVVQRAYESFVEVQKTAKLELPKNKRPKGSTPNETRRLRYLDCAVLRHLHKMIESEEDIEPYDTVRGMFVEGEPVYPGAGFNEQSHVQIAVRNNDCILGIFHPRPYPAI